MTKLSNFLAKTVFLEKIMSGFKKPLLVLAVFSTCLFFASCTTNQAQAGDGIGIHGRLSRIEYGNNTAYIFGSMHIASPHWFPLAPIVEDAIERSDIFVFEYDLSLNETVVAAVAQEFAMNQTDTLGVLLPLLTEEQYNNFRESIATFPQNIFPRGAHFYDLSPFALEIITVWYLFEEHMGLSQDYSVDTYVLEAAQRKGAPILGLNHIVQEFEHMFSMSQEANLESLANFPTLEKGIQDAQFLFDAYTNQDIAALTELFVSEGEMTAGEAWMYETLMVQRSIEFAQEIQRLLIETETPTTFFITMGIGHMVGDTYANVFVYLQNQGFEIERLYNGS